MRSHSTIAIIGAPLDLGAGRRGVDMGPSALRLAGLNASLNSLGYAVEDLGNVSVAQQESVPAGPENAKYLPQIAKTCTKLAHLVRDAVVAGHLPLVLGGDHSVAAGTVAGVASAFRQRGESIGLIWIDAHADMNTPESSPSGNVHGMPLACCIGRGPVEANPHPRLRAEGCSEKCRSHRNPRRRRKRRPPGPLLGRHRLHYA